LQGADQLIREDSMKKVMKGYSALLLCIFFMAVAPSLFAGTAPTLEILSPRNGEDISYGGEVVIAISIYDEDGDVDLSSVRLEVNDVDVTRQANTSTFLVTYQVPDTTQPGRQYITLRVSDREGNVAVHESYFNVRAEPKKEKKFTYNGTVTVGAEYDKEATQSAIGNLQVDMYGSFSPSLDYALTIDATNREASDKQRVSEFRFDLYSPWVTLVLGDATPHFTDYTIDGKRVFGVHVLPQFGWFGFELVAGFTEKAVDADDPVNEIETFKQMLYGGRLKFGNPESILWGLSFLKVKDDRGSIVYLDNAASPTPQDNLVVGTDLNFSFMDGGIKLETEGNMSFLNTDITGGSATLPEELDWLSKLDWLLVANENMVPIRPGLTNLAAKGGITVGPFSENTFYGEYSFVGPSYYSLANPAIVNDRQGFLLRDSIWLLNRALFINGSYQRYADNLKNTKNYTTKNSGISGSAYVYPTPFLSINAGADVAIVKNDAPASDIEAVDTINTTIYTGIAQDVEILASATNVYFTFTTSLFSDRNTSANDSNVYTTRLGAISFFDNFPLDTKAVLGYDFGDPENSLYMEGYAGYRFLREQTLYPYMGAIYETGPEQLDFRTGLDYDITPDWRVTAELQYLTSPAVDDLFIEAFATYEF
jgi:hypothetical protein